MSKIIIIGTGHDHLAPGGRQALAGCGAAFTALRFHHLLAGFQGEIHPIAPINDALAGMAKELAKGDVAVLASGDPLFFGIGRLLIDRFGRENIEILPAISAMQLAFARLKLPWQDAFFATLHGREIKNLAGVVLPHPKVCLLTDRKNSPDRIAQALSDDLAAKGIDPSTANIKIFVAENLGLPGERLTSGAIDEIAMGSFSDLNVMIILRDLAEDAPFRLGLKEEDIIHSRSLITKDEVRAALLHNLKLPPQGVMWDIGAGSGSVSIEAARLAPDLRIFSIEHEKEQQQNIVRNRGKFGLINIELIKGRAPKALNGLPRPDRVFIGGSSGSLAEIIELVAAKINPPGLVAVTAVTTATREAAPRLLHNQGFKVGLTTIAVNRSTYPLTGEGYTKLNPITIISGAINKSRPGTR